MKTIKLLLVSGLLFLFLSGYQTNACPDPTYTQTTIPLTILGCDYDVTICYKCGAASPGDLTISSFVKRFSNPPCVHPQGTTYQQIMDEILRQLIDGRYILQFCPSPIPPCTVNPSLYFKYTITVPICWQKYNDNGNMIYQICSTSSAECQITISVCRDPITGKIYSTPVAWVPLNFPPNCADLEGDVEDPTSGNTSNCFHIVNNCYNP
jgi:hypothetical protein